MVARICSTIKPLGIDFNYNYSVFDQELSLLIFTIEHEQCVSDNGLRIKLIGKVTFWQSISLQQ